MAANLHVVPSYYFVVRQETDTILLCHRIRKYPDSPVHTLSDSLRIYYYFFFYTLESGFKNIRIHCRIGGMRVDGSRTRKEKVADLKISGYVWTGRDSGCGHAMITNIYI